MLTLIKKHEDYSFIMFINNYTSFIIIFNILFKFLHEKYFSRYVFKLIYLLKYKTFVFINSLKVLGFEESVAELRPSIKYKKKI